MSAYRGTVYLLHFHEAVGNLELPTGYALHYTGWAWDLFDRLSQHRNGTSGARLMEVVFEAGITWELARTWPGDRNEERRIKNRGGASRLCPSCGVKPRRAATPALPTPRFVSLPAPARIPAYERGAAKALAIIGEQITAGWPADRIAAFQVTQFRDYEEATARPGAREWYRGYQETAAALVEGLQDESVSLAELAGAAR